MSNNPSEHDAQLTDHAYDGIQEFDNPLPGWWKWMFVASIVFSVFYALFFHIGAPGRTIAEQYDAELAANTLLQFAEIGDLEGDEATVLEYMNKDSWMKVGAVTFKTHCISCHGRDGEGKVGPNLTDEAYKNVRKLEDIVRVLNKGAGNGAMPAWGARLHQNDIVLLAAYVATLRGKNVAGKAADGNPIPPWPDYVPPTETPESSDGEGNEG